MIYLNAFIGLCTVINLPVCVVRLLFERTLAVFQMKCTSVYIQVCGSKFIIHVILCKQVFVFRRIEFFFQHATHAHRKPTYVGTQSTMYFFNFLLCRDIAIKYSEPCVLLNYFFTKQIKWCSNNLFSTMRSIIVLQMFT